MKCLRKERLRNHDLEKKEKQAISILCMIEIWMVYRYLESYFNKVVKIENSELTDAEKSQFHAKADCNSFFKKYTYCYLCKFPLKAKEINLPNKLTRECSCLDFVIRREYQFLKNVLSREEIASSNHLCFLAAYYKALTFILKVHKFFSRQSKYPIVFDESTLNEEYKIFIVEYMSDCSTVGHMHKQI